jgi:SnoaL-like protein
MSEAIEAPAAIREFVAATNAGDSARFVAAFTEDAYLNDWGREFHGHAGVASWDRTDNIGKRSRFELHGVTPGRQPGEYDADITVRGDGFNGRGVMAFTVDGDRVARLVIS